MKLDLFCKKLPVVLFSIYCLSASSLFAAIINVPSDQATIAAAVQAANDGDVIIIAPGLYRQQNKIFIDKRLIISSRWHTTKDKKFINETVLDGVNKGDSLFETVHGKGIDVEISGLTITRFQHPLVLEDSAVIEHNFFTNNSKDAISFEDTSSGYAGYNTIENTSDDGIDIDAREGNFVIEFNTIRNNGDDGIEIRLLEKERSQITYDIHDNIISGNDEDGIQLIDHSPDDGGRIFNIYNNIIDSNLMAGLGCMGDGDTIENYEGANLLERINFFNNTVINNTVGVTGGDNFIAVNNIIANNTNEGIKRLRGNSVIAHTLFYNNGVNFIDTITDTNLILNRDPQYNEGSYQLFSNSPAIDKGVSSFMWKGDLRFDISPSKYTGLAHDLGAKEFGSNKGVANISPTVRAGVDQVVHHPNNIFSLQGAVNDDGLPSTAILTSTWAQDEGPSTVLFADINNSKTNVSFIKQGKYQLRLTGFDGELTTNDSIIVRYANAGNGHVISVRSPGTTFFEAENYAYLYGNAEKVRDLAASGRKTISVTNKLDTDAFTEHTLLVADQDVRFYVWVSAKAIDQNNHSLFVSFRGGEEKEIAISSSNTFDWFKIPGSFTSTAGSWPLIIKTGSAGEVSWDQIIFSTDPNYKIFIRGDGTNNGTVDISDIVRVINITLGSDTQPINGADCNTDGTVNISRYYLYDKYGFR